MNAWPPPPPALTRRLLTHAAALALSLTALTAAALKDDDKQPMLIEADSVQVDEGQSTSLYVGHVQVDQGTMRLLADQVTVHHRSDRHVKYIIARGTPASYKQDMDGGKPPVQGYAKRMDYDAERDELVLTDEALLIQGADRIASERIVYDRATARMQAGGGGRVKLTMTPEAKKDAKEDTKGDAKKDAKPKVPGATTQPLRGSP